MKDKCECGKTASHTIFEKGKRKRLCCACYVQAGNPPADWHRGCMLEAGLIKELKPSPGTGTKRSSLI